MALALLLVCSFTFYLVVSVEAQTTNVSVINPATGDKNFIFYTNTTSVGTRFNATIWVYNVTDLYSYQLKLTVNDTLLNITNAWIPTWDSQWVFNSKTTIELGPVFYDFDSDGFNEGVMIGDSILLGNTFNGTGLLAVIEFEIIFAPTVGKVSSNLDINNAGTILLDSDTNDIPITKISGYYEFIGGPKPKVQTEVFFNINPNPATAGQTIILKGILVDQFSQPISNETVELYGRPLAGSWQHIASVTASTYGIFMWQATIPGTVTPGTYIIAVYYPGSPMYASTYNLAILIIQ